MNFSVLSVEGVLRCVLPSGFQALGKLPHLRKFLFMNFRDRRRNGNQMEAIWKHDLACLQLCAEFLPHLRVVGIDPPCLPLVEVNSPIITESSLSTQVT